MGTQSLFLIGMTATGKSSIGKLVAQSLSLPFYDSDAVIEERTGVEISWIFNLEGEAKFRQREAAVIDELTQLDRIVLATGGGAVLRPQNRKRLGERGLVVHLQAPVDILVARARVNRDRPLLQDTDVEVTLEEMLRIRDPLYRSIADKSFESVSDRGTYQVAGDIVAWYESEVRV